MAENKRTPIQAVADRIEISRRYLRGETQAAIAASLGLTQPQISYDLRILEERWRTSGIFDFDAAKGKELARINLLELTYWEAWEASREDKEIATQKQTGAGNAARKDVMLRKEGQAGNPAFLAGVMTCIDRRCKLLGLDAPVKQEITGAEGGPIDVRLTYAQRVSRIATLLDLARTRRDRAIASGNAADSGRTGGSDDDQSARGTLAGDRL